MRVTPKSGVNSGWLYLAFAVPQVQMQVKACSCGSVVDAVYPSDLDKVVLPPVDEVRGEAAWQCWRDFEAASALEAATVGRLEASLTAEQRQMA